MSFFYLIAICNNYIMNKLLITLILVSCISVAHSQTNAWFTSSADAKAYAIDKKVPILLVFAGSDWCKPCMMLKTDILHSAAFETYFPSQMAVLYLDFPMQAKNKLPAELKKQNELLAEKYNKSGAFPAMILINTEGKVLGSFTYTNQTPAVFVDQCKTLLASIQAQ